MTFYHVLNRGVDKRSIVLDDSDRQRFVRSLYLFNNKDNAPNGVTQADIHFSKSKLRKLLVHIHAWCLMDNHYHILLTSTSGDDSNISLFMKKLNMGYAKFFNEKYERTGALWQGKYKKVLISRDQQFLYIPYYIHLNPLDRNLKGWRDGGVKNVSGAIEQLSSYKWSSYLDYQGLKNFPSILHKEELQPLLGNFDIQSEKIKQIIQDPILTKQSSVIEV